MSADIKIRTIDFQFPDDIEMNWNPGNPEFGNIANIIFFMAPGFEKYFIKAIRASTKRITDERVLKEADLFCKQEAIHSKFHREHINVLAKKYPGLDKIRDRVIEMYDDLYEEESLDFHLAYAALGEGTFSPGSKFIIDNRADLFRGADPRIASFFMWHMVEEYEHRSSAVNVYNEIVGSYWYKIKCAPKICKHLYDVGKFIRDGFDECVPATDDFAVSKMSGFGRHIPLSKKTRAVWDILLTAFPGHDPEKETLPPWADKWFEDEEKGVDMTMYYPTISP